MNDREERFLLLTTNFLLPNRFLVPADITVGKFVYEIRKHMKLSPEKAIFLFVNNVLPPTGKNIPPFAANTNPHDTPPLSTAELMSHIYNKYKDADGFLYITYSGENTFGQ